MVRALSSLSLVAGASIAFALAFGTALFAQDEPASTEAPNASPPAAESDDPTRRLDAAREAAKPRLLLATEDVFVHFVRPEPTPFNMRRWDGERYGDLLLTQRDDGSMVRLIGARLEAIPTRRLKYFELRLAGIGIVGDRLVAVAWHTTSWDRPPQEYEKEQTAARYEAEPTISRFKTVYVFSLADGSPIGQRPLTHVDCSKLKQLPDLLPASDPVVLDEEQAACYLKLLDEADAELEEQATP